MHKNNIRIKEMHQIINQDLIKEGVYEALTYDQVRRFVNQQPWHRRVLQKFDPRTRRSVGSSRSLVYRSELPYQRIEIDCTQLDIFVHHRFGKVPVRPHVCVAIDVATGFPLATELCLHTPDTVHALKTVERAMYGYTKAEFDKFGISNQLRYSGRPQTIVLDNGTEFRSESFSSLTTFGIEVEHNPAYSPYRKPFVERFNRSLKDFTSSLPGSTRTPLKGGKPFTEIGKKKASISFEELQMLVTRFVFDEYSIKPLNRHVLHCVAKGESYGVSPAERMINLQKLMIPLEPISMRDIANARMIREKKAIHKDGITHQNCKFSSPEFAALYAETGPGKKVDVLIDPIDCTYIDVVDPIRKGSKVRVSNLYWDAKNNPPVDYKMLKELMDITKKTHRHINVATVSVEYQKKMGLFFDEKERKSKPKTRKHGDVKRDVASFAKGARSAETERAPIEKDVSEGTKFSAYTLTADTEYDNLTAVPVLQKEK